MNQGITCLLPPLLVVIAGIYSRRSLESLLLGCLLGTILIDGWGFPATFLTMLSETLANPSLVWVILVCGIYGMLIQLIVASGSALAFGSLLLKTIKTRRAALTSTWFTGLFIFPDDYLSALSTGVSMRSITDRFQVSRPLLAYLVNTTAAPVCALVPLSTWGVFTGKLLEDNGLFPAGKGLWGYVSVLPYQFYALAALAISFGVAKGWVPLWGKMRQAEKRFTAPATPTPEATTTRAKPIDFLFPMVVLVGGTLALRGDALQGAALAFVLTIAWYALRGVLPYAVMSDQSLAGFKEMLHPLAILSLSFFLKAVGDKMGLTPYVIEAVKGHFPAFLLPAGMFVLLAFISYTTCSSWGLYTVALPIVIPLSLAMDISPLLMVGAVLSAGVFGSNASFFSDCTILTATSTECSPNEHSFAQFPYAMLAFGVAMLGFLVAFWI